MRIKAFAVLCLTVFLAGCWESKTLSEEQTRMFEQVRQAPEKSLLLKEDGSLFGIKSPSNEDGSFSIERPGGVSIPSVQLSVFIPHIEVVVGPDDPGYAEYLAKVD